ncbi:MAG TPA: LPS assembly lipoprotein LptE [Gemmatimonadales bacterium]|nr:LPS assembly lipoprotein LptE [Gemmatimonadales bacterium]
MRRRGAVRRLAAWAVLPLGLEACLYGFAGGGLPPHIRTVAVLPFDNQTTDPQLTLEVSEAVREAMERRLGLRLAAEESADALVRGTITRYEPDIPLSFQPGDATREVQVTRRRVQLAVTVEIVDQRAGRTLWQRSGLTVDGEYDPPNEAEGKQVALRKLVTDIVDGAQSQW